MSKLLAMVLLIRDTKGTLGSGSADYPILRYLGNGNNLSFESLSSQPLPNKQQQVL